MARKIYNKTNEVDYIIKTNDGDKIVYKREFVGVVNEQPNKLNLPVNTIVGKCPKCGEPLVIKKGKFGLFVSCSGFKKGCRNTYNIKTFKVFDKMLLNKLNVYDAIKNDKESVVFGIENDKEYYNSLSSELQKEINGYKNQFHDFQEKHICGIKVTL